MLQMTLQEKKNIGATFIRFYLGFYFYGNSNVCDKSNHLVVQLYDFVKNLVKFLV